ncbi:MAG TPA: hypothetical protein VH575_07610 [Gemmataceae bacterium]|jgi:hypothetical protein
MKANYQTLDQYLDALDCIKEKVAEETRGMNAEQVKKYFAVAARTLQEVTGQAVRVRRERSKYSTPKP